jgi:ubiquitin C-terminal hydrolase
MAEQYYYYDPRYVPGEFGLNNTGVICWCNSILQALISCSSFNQTLLECKEKLSGNQFALEYIKLIETSLIDNTDTRIEGSSAMIHRRFMERMQRQGNTIRFGNSQECVDEALSLIIDMLGLPEIERRFTSIYECVVVCRECNKRTICARDKNFRIEVFTEVKLETEEQFRNWIKNHPSELNNYKCECGSTGTKLRVECLKRVSEILILLFNKFQRKDKRWYPESIEFPTAGNKSLKYKLVSTVEHYGTMSGGHYTARALREGGFKLFNDSSVVGSNSSPTEQTFMLVYHMVKDEEPMEELIEQ